MTISLRSVIEAGHDPLAFIGIDDEPHEHLGDLLRMATETANSASA